MDHQTQIQELTLRSELFDRGMAIYTTIYRALDQILDTDPDDDDGLPWDEVKDAIRQSAFLFDQATSTRLSEIWHRSTAFLGLAAEFDGFRRKGQPAPRELEEKYRAEATLLGRNITTLHEVFGDYMRLWWAHEVAVPR